MYIEEWWRRNVKDLFNVYDELIQSSVIEKENGPLILCNLNCSTSAVAPSQLEV